MTVHKSLYLFQEAISSDPADSVSVVVEMVEDGHIPARVAVQIIDTIVSQVVANTRANLTGAVPSPHVS